MSSTKNRWDVSVWRMYWNRVLFSLRSFSLPFKLWLASMFAFSCTIKLWYQRVYQSIECITDKAIASIFVQIFEIIFYILSILSIRSTESLFLSYVKNKLYILTSQLQLPMANAYAIEFFSFLSHISLTFRGDSTRKKRSRIWNVWHLYYEKSPLHSLLCLSQKRVVCVHFLLHLRISLQKYRFYRELAKKFEEWINLSLNFA